MGATSGLVTRPPWEAAARRPLRNHPPAAAVSAAISSLPWLADVRRRIADYALVKCRCDDGWQASRSTSSGCRLLPAAVLDRALGRLGGLTRALDAPDAPTGVLAGVRGGLETHPLAARGAHFP